MGELLRTRRQQTAERFQELQKHLAESEKLCGGKACVYATGSFARGEASKHSDLDLFIVGEGSADGRQRSLSNLDEIVVKADLIQATRELNFPEFSGDGEYLAHYTVEQLVESLGEPEDDVTNTFTARLLLLLESTPLIGAVAYHNFTQAVIAPYWRDYEDHKNDFMPAFLANDILRMWRTFCVNYEARTKTEPAELKAKRKLKNYKLKHSRLLTCYSALLYLAAVYSAKKTVSPTDVLSMISLTPTQRVEWLLKQEAVQTAYKMLESVLELYERFLKSTDVPEETLIQAFMNKEQSKEYLRSAYQFGDEIFAVMEAIGGGNRFHRLLVV